MPTGDFASAKRRVRTARGNERPTHRRRRHGLAVAASVALAVVMGGCRESLFHTDDAMSQFERTDAIRQGVEPAFLLDEYGNRRPNLAGRLVR